MDPQVKSRSAGKRLTEDRKAAETGVMTDDQFELILAVEDYKKKRNLTYVSTTQILEIALFLGYRKSAQKGEYRLDRDKDNNIELGTKQCNMCSQVLPLEDFNQDLRSKDGVQGSCKECSAAKKAAKHQRQRISKKFQTEGELNVQPC